MKALGLRRPFDGEGQIDAAHRLKVIRLDVTSHDLRLANGHAAIEDGFSKIWRDVAGVRVLLLSHHHGDFSAEMLFIKAEAGSQLPP